MDYFSAIAKSEMLSFAAMWMNLENVMLSEISQKDKCYMISLNMWNLRKQNRRVYIAKQKDIYSKINRLTDIENKPRGYQWGKGSGNPQDRAM